MVVTNDEDSDYNDPKPIALSYNQAINSCYKFLVRPQMVISFRWKSLKHEATNVRTIPWYLNNFIFDLARVTTATGGAGVETAGARALDTIHLWIYILCGVYKVNIWCNVCVMFL